MIQICSVVSSEGDLETDLAVTMRTLDGTAGKKIN